MKTKPTPEPRLRLFPVVVAAAALLALLKFAGIAANGGFALLGVTAATAQDAGAAAEAASEGGDPGQETAEADEAVQVDTGNAENGADPDTQQPLIDGTLAEGRRIRLNQPTTPVSPAERALLESLRERRVELDARASNIEMRENLLKAAEQRIDEKLKSLKAYEAKIAARFKEQEELETEQFASLVSMYESMKPKDAARIFSRLETGILVSVARRMNPRKLGPVLSEMDSASAERLTVEIARASTAPGLPAGELESLAEN